jgi:uncharacterized membrane protein YqjE
MSEKPVEASKGLLDSLAALAATLITIARTRLDLLSSDLEEERDHFFSLLLLGMVALFCLGVGVLLGVLLLVAAFWDSYRLLSIGVLCGLFLVAGFTVARVALHKMRTKPRIFSASMAELLKDRQQLTTRS